MNKKELKRIISDEKKLNFSMSTLVAIKMRFTKDISWNNWQYIKTIRYLEYFSTKKTLFGKIQTLFLLRKKNRVGEKLGFEIPEHTLGKNIKIFHSGCIVIHGEARIGEGCILHGNCLIGKSRASDLAPVIGNHVNIGYGAIIIGPIVIADGVTIGAGAVVNKSIDEQNVTVVGVPAKIVSSK